MLQGQGYQVFEAGDGMQALQMLSEQPIALAIVDLFMPGRDGIAIAEEIVKRSPPTKLLLLTGYGEHARAKTAQQIFKENYLEKTALEKTLFKKVQEILQTL